MLDYLIKKEAISCDFFENVDYIVVSKKFQRNSNKIIFYTIYLCTYLTEQTNKLSI